MKQSLHDSNQILGEKHVREENGLPIVNLYRNLLVVGRFRSFIAHYQ